MVSLHALPVRLIPGLFRKLPKQLGEPNPIDSRFALELGPVHQKREATLRLVTEANQRRLGPNRGVGANVLDHFRETCARSEDHADACLFEEFEIFFRDNSAQDNQSIT